MPSDSPPPVVPDRLHQYFWEYSQDRLDWAQNRHTVILRLLQAGGMDAVQWLREQISDEEIRDFLVRRQGRGIDPRRLRFWALVLDIPRTEVDRWIGVEKSNPWSRRTH